MPKVISMINWKGGVGKSTLTLHLGVNIMRQDGDTPRVLLIDLDPQCNLSYLALGVTGYVDAVYQNGQATLKDIFDAYFDGKSFKATSAIIPQPIKANASEVWSNVDILPSHHELVLVDMRLARERRSGTSHQEETQFELNKLSIIHNAIQQVASEYDYVLLDCPPNINLVTQNAFFASEAYFIPAIPDFLSTVGISLIKQEMEKLNKSFNGMIGYAGTDIDYSDTELKGIIFNMVTERSGAPKKSHKNTIASVSNSHPGMVLDSYATLGDGITRAADNNLTVFSYRELPEARANAEKQASLLDSITQEFLSRI